LDALAILANLWAEAKADFRVSLATGAAEGVALCGAGRRLCGISPVY
jgi:hypothetical protein